MDAEPGFGLNGDLEIATAIPHVPVNFKTALLPSTRFKVILVIVEDFFFSKSAHFIALPKLSSAQQMAEVLLREAVHYFGSVHGDFQR